MLNIKNKNWELYITRPFTLFGASIWYESYASKWCLQIIGRRINNCLMVEYPKGVVRYYRDGNEQKNISRAFNDLALKREDKLIRLFKRGLVLNKIAASALKKNSFKDLKTALDFLMELFFICTVLPFRTGDAVVNKAKNKRIIGLVKNLRMTSYYGRIVNKIIVGLAFKEAKFFGAENKEEINFVTLREILRRKKVDIRKRILKSNSGKFFVYQNLNGAERVSWIKNPTSLIRKIEKPEKRIKVGIIQGNTACGGLVKGRVRLVLTNKIKSVRFNKGDVLVANSTNPVLMPLIKKCSAIITDEGGLTCHAAIISRELKIPCIIGTKNATRILKDGDKVEVDAGRGIIRIIKKK